MRIVWLDAAIANFTTQLDYIARFNPLAAQLIAETIHRSVGRLSEFP